ncbi:hypothetical protein B9Z55_026440 [Caenorhabditis nigoni]|uniref:Uncharacterized protein n=1 Tax=Caenorhabditis nigoni TaxID=1611254 RepID=A0A2G5T2T8_9PELO|nr:hypothetical protein B9Z55_026440 [Caenorhabditis nigoni]
MARAVERCVHFKSSLDLIALRYRIRLWNEKLGCPHNGPPKMNETGCTVRTNDYERLKKKFGIVLDEQGRIRED